MELQTSLSTSVSWLDILLLERFEVYQKFCWSSTVFVEGLWVSRVGRSTLYRVRQIRMFATTLSRTDYPVLENQSCFLWRQGSYTARLEGRVLANSAVFPSI